TAEEQASAAGQASGTDDDEVLGVARQPAEQGGKRIAAKVDHFDSGHAVGSGPVARLVQQGGEGLAVVRRRNEVLEHHNDFGALFGPDDGEGQGGTEPARDLDPKLAGPTGVDRPVKADEDPFEHGTPLPGFYSVAPLEPFDREG